MQAASALQICLYLLFLLSSSSPPLRFSSLLFCSASLSPAHLAWASMSLGAASLPFHPLPFHAAACCQAEGSYVHLALLYWGRHSADVPSMWLRQALPTQAASALRLCLLLLFFSASLSGFHLGCTAHSFEAWPSFYGWRACRRHLNSFLQCVCVRVFMRHHKKLQAPLYINKEKPLQHHKRHERPYKIYVCVKTTAATTRMMTMILLVITMMIMMMMMMMMVMRNGDTQSSTGRSCMSMRSH